VALCAHSVLALAFACRRRRRVQTTAAQRVPRGSGERSSLCPCGRRGRYPSCAGRGGGVRRVPRWLPGSLSFPSLSSLSRSRFSSAEWTQFFLMCCVCYFPYVQFGLFFSRSNTCHRGDIQPPSPLRYFKSFFSSPYRSQSYSCCCFPFPLLTKQELSKLYFFFVSFSFLLCLCTTYP
jgi:hypothetical protein